MAAAAVGGHRMVGWCSDGLGGLEGFLLGGCHGGLWRTAEPFTFDSWGNGGCDFPFNVLDFDSQTLGAVTKTNGLCFSFQASTALFISKLLLLRFRRLLLMASPGVLNIRAVI